MEYSSIEDYLQAFCQVALTTYMLSIYTAGWRENADSGQEKLGGTTRLTRLSGAEVYRGIFAQAMTMVKKQILARSIGIQKENCG